ncbi:MAG: hypothetical protein N3G76_00030 [Candidatus Micrarchaeota archaeon]|nr:hypothetical protein [Candidatus Micrarchaeota archaeon]
MVLVERKVKGGKLVRVDVRFEDERIAGIRITGDFFVHPEDALLCIEQKIIGLHINSIEDGVKEAFSSANAEIVGFSALDISEMIAEAYMQQSAGNGSSRPST